VDIYNPDAKHITKQAGLTPEERKSHSLLLAETGFVDAFRYLHGDKLGQFTYWSQRSFSRPVNKGLRLDYFLCSPDMYGGGGDCDDNTAAAAAAVVPSVFDCYQLPFATVGVSDHCPVVLVLEMSSSSSNSSSNSSSSTKK
jgi:exonuclease III